MKFNKSVLFTVIFIVLAGILAAIQYFGLGVVYAAKEEAPIVVVAEILLILVIVVYVRRYASWDEIGFGKINWLRVLWIAPLLILAVAKGVIFINGVIDTNPSSAVVLGILITLVGTFLIGFAEEGMFRGVLLRGALTKFNVLAAMLISSIGFSLLHSINVFAGYPVPDMLDQLRATFIIGLLYAPLAILVGNLWPLIITHFIWDFVGLAKVQLSSPLPISTIGGAVDIALNLAQYILTVVFWIVIIVRWRKGTYKRE